MDQDRSMGGVGGVGMIVCVCREPLILAWKKSEEAE
jgi:hypothetical protein